MTLDNLIDISLEKITPHPDAIKRLLHAAERNIADYSGDIIPESAVVTCKLTGYFNKVKSKRFSTHT